MEFLHFDLITFIETVGYFGLFGIVFAESGLLVGIFFPGDSLLFTAGFLASQGFFNIFWLTPLMFIAAVAGDSVGYAFGHRVGKRLFQKEDSIFFHKKHLERANHFYHKHGGKTVTIARFMPVVRTFAPIIAGMGDMRYPRFLFFNVIGALLWAVCLPLAGFYLGSAIPSIDRYLLPIIVTIIFLSVLPTIIHILKEKEDREKIIELLKRLLKR